MNLLNLLLPILNVLLGLYQRHLKELDDEKIKAIAQNETIHKILRRQAMDEEYVRKLKGVDSKGVEMTKDKRKDLKDIVK